MEKELLTYDELDELYDEHNESDDCDAKEIEKRFTIDTEEKANWAIKKIKEEQKRFEAYEKTCNFEIEDLKNKIIIEKNKSEGRNNWLLWRLNEYLDSENAPIKKTKSKISVKLARGEIIRTLPKVSYGSELPKNTALLAWVKENAPEFVKTTETVDWGGLKKKLSVESVEVMDKETGEMIDLGRKAVYRKNKKDEDGSIVDCLNITDTVAKVEVK